MAKETIAHPYARAAFEYAKENNCLSEWRIFLANFSLFFRQSEVLTYLSQPGLVEKNFLDLWSIFESISEEFEQLKVSKSALGQLAFKNFFRLLVEYRRLELAQEIHAIFDELCVDEAQLIFAEVTSAKLLTQPQRDQISAALKIRFSEDSSTPRQIELKCEEDPSLLAGLKVKVGDWIFDNSLQGRFNRLKNQLENL